MFKRFLLTAALVAATVTSSFGAGVLTASSDAADAIAIGPMVTHDRLAALPGDADLRGLRTAAGAAANPTPAGFPKVQEDAQKARDTDRKRILEQELAGEQRSLDHRSITCPPVTGIACPVS